MTPAECIADLDGQLAAHGETIDLRRLTTGPNGVQIPLVVSCRAFVRGYKPTELVGGITQNDSKVILSPTEIIAAGWTSGRPANEDGRLPMKGNRVMIAGKARNVEAAGPFYVAGELVRIELQVR